jgi:uncharacterized SAM-binding protein YcdF (DUF218 family)
MTPHAAVTPPKTVRRRTRRIILLALLATALGVYLGRSYLLTQAARFLDISEPPHAVDYVMLLGGDHHMRPMVAAALYRAGLARGVLVPGLLPSEDVEAGVSLPEEEILQRVLVHGGVPRSVIQVLDGASADTRDEAYALRAFLDKRPQSTVAVVTSDYHTRRARIIVHKALGPRAAQVYFVGAPSESFTRTNWWHSEDGFQIYAAEYLKLVYYQLAY